MYICMLAATERHLCPDYLFFAAASAYRTILSCDDEVRGGRISPLLEFSHLLGAFLLLSLLLLLLLSPSLFLLAIVTDSPIIRIRLLLLLLLFL